MRAIYRRNACTFKGGGWRPQSAWNACRASGGSDASQLALHFMPQRPRVLWRMIARFRVAYAETVGEAVDVFAAPSLAR